MTHKHPVDVIVGRNIADLRRMLGWSQSKLAEPLGISFQQMQKYENAHNRVSASRLWDIAAVLGVEVETLFVGAK